MREIAIAQIHVGKRLRQDLGDIQGLADSIEEVGLMHPIVVDDEANLVAGYRRLSAVKKLGWRKIECNVISLDDIKIGEIHENVQRKDFTPSEIAAITEYVESTRLGHRPKKGSKLDPLPGKTSDVVAKITNQSPAQIYKIKAIANAVKKEPQKYAHIMERLDSDKMSVDTAHKIVTREERSLPKVPLPSGVYDVIYADPSIRFKNRSIRGSADNNYLTMEISEIARGIFNGEDIRNHIAKNAVIFMWFPSSIIFDEFKIGTYTVSTDGMVCEMEVNVPAYKYILNSWGFTTFKTDFIWDKKIVGPGSYSMNQHETLIMGFKGDVPPPAERFPSVYSEQRTQQHSQKPLYYYTMIEKMYPKRKYLELWSRHRFNDKWTVWGNQIR